MDLSSGLILIESPISISSPVSVVLGLTSSGVLDLSSGLILIESPISISSPVVFVGDVSSNSLDSGLTLIESSITTLLFDSNTSGVDTFGGGRYDTISGAVGILPSWLISDPIDISSPITISSSGVDPPTPVSTPSFRPSSSSSSSLILPNNIVK